MYDIAMIMQKDKRHQKISRNLFGDWYGYPCKGKQTPEKGHVGPRGLEHQAGMLAVGACMAEFI